MSHRRLGHLAVHGRQHGVSLIIVLIMLVVIGLTSAAAIRNANSSERLTNNVRMQNLAHQYADAALRYCESQIARADDDADRVASLKEAVINAVVGSPSAWSNAQSWNGGGGAFGTLTVTPENQIKSADSSFRPAVLPQCVAEKQVFPDGFAYVVTARGFSPDYTANAATGVTTGGSVVWLQSTLVLK